MTQPEFNLLQKYRELSSEGKDEVLAYLRWMRSMESQIRPKRLERIDSRRDL
jgi:hypothetical protein